MIQKIKSVELIVKVDDILPLLKYVEGYCPYQLVL